MKVSNLIDFYRSQSSRVVSKNNNQATEQKSTLESVNQVSKDLPAVKLDSNIDNSSRNEKVARIKSQVQDGSYNVSSEDVAKSLIREFA